MTVTADLTSENGKVRLNIGDIESPYLVPNEVIAAYLAQYPDPTFTSGIRVYKATIGTLRYLKGKYAQSAARMREREGGVEVEIYGKEKYTAICDLLEWFINNPPEELAIPRAMPIIGGTTNSERDLIEGDAETRLNRPSLSWFDRNEMQSEDSLDIIESDYFHLRD